MDYPSPNTEQGIMAYRKTETVLAAAAARKTAIIAAALDIIGKVGVSALNTDALAERANVSVGLIYNYFPDKTEIIASAIALLLERDLATIRAATSNTPVKTLASALAVFFDRLWGVHLVRARTSSPVYQVKMREEFTRMIKAATDLPPAQASIASAGALGALYGMADLSGAQKRNAPAAVLFVLKGIGVGDAVARRALEQA